MKPYTWDPAKNERLIQERGLSFETILWSIQNGGLLDTFEHPDIRKYPGQRIFVVKALDYVFLVPFMENDAEIRLITIIPSRKAVRKYLARGVSMKLKLDKEEKALLRSYEAGEWKPVKNHPAEKKRYETYARETIKKNRRINIRISEYDLKAIQLKAMEEGVPYQTFISSVLHKVADGRLSIHQ